MYDPAASLVGERTAVNIVQFVDQMSGGKAVLSKRADNISRHQLILERSNVGWVQVQSCLAVPEQSFETIVERDRKSHVRFFRHVFQATMAQSLVLRDVFAVEACLISIRG